MSAKTIAAADGEGVGTARWIRLPSGGRPCPFTGFSRSFFYEAMKENRIKTANIRQPGKLTGVRLVWLPSVLEYIERNVETDGSGRRAVAE